MSTERRALAKNTGIQVIGKIIGTILGLASFSLLLYALDTPGYGALTRAQTFASVFAIFVDFGLTLTVTQMISEPGADEEKILSSMLSVRVLSALIFLSIAPLSTLFMPETTGFRIAVLCFSGSFFLTSVAQVFVGVFQKRLSLGRVAVAEAVNRLVAFLGIVIVWIFHLGLGAAAFAFVVGGLFHITIMLTGVTKSVPIRFSWDAKIIRAIFTKSWPIGVSIIFNLIYMKGDVLFMWLFQRTDTEIGYYGMAYKVIDVVTTVPIALMGLLLPMLIVAWETNNRPLFAKRMQNGFDTLIMLGIPFAFGSIYAGVPVMTFIRSDLTPSGQLLALLGPTASAVFFGSLFSYTVVAIGKQRMMTFAYAFVAILTVLGYAFFIPRFGIWAAAAMSLFAETLIGILAAIVVITTTKWVPNLSLVRKSILASLAMSIALVALKDMHVFIIVLVGTIVYAATLALFGGPSPKSLLRLFRPDTQVTT
jgi:O-antigen/teichoic acid export membrane protein